VNNDCDSLEEALSLVKPIDPPTMSVDEIRVGGPCSKEKMENAKRWLSPSTYRAWLKSEEARGLVPEGVVETAELSGVLQDDEPQRFERVLGLCIGERKTKEERSKELQGAKKGGGNRVAPMADRVQEAANAWWKRISKLSVREVAEKLANREKADGRRVAPGLFGGFETIRKKIKKPTPG